MFFVQVNIVPLMKGFYNYYFYNFSFNIFLLDVMDNKAVMKVRAAVKLEAQSIHLR